MLPEQELSNNLRQNIETRVIVAHLNAKDEARELHKVINAQVNERRVQVLNPATSSIAFPFKFSENQSNVPRTSSPLGLALLFEI